ncbi:hypothetical protein NUH16_011466 [Penicillium rubens]|nr:hypothetical protein NUH16_011466 [Penicillium rubens]KAJ5277696.1 hypothetical protein N7524_003849 [Penicillium chrysogenum]
MKLFETPLDIWLSIKDFLTPADVENIINTSSILWKQIFKNTSWLEFALTFDGCSPVLIGHNLSAYRPRKSSTRLYLALIAGDYSGDLRYESEKFFAALQDGWKYDKNRYEVQFPSGITLNIYDVIECHESVKLPLEKVFTNTKQGVYSEYCYYRYPAIKELRSSDIAKWDPDYRPHPHALGYEDKPHHSSKSYEKQAMGKDGTKCARLLSALILSVLSVLLPLLLER